MTREELIEDQRQRAVGTSYFLRSLGFRRVGNSVWFCLAKDANHPSRHMPSMDDYDTHNLEIASPVAVELHNHMSNLDDDACVAYLTTILQTYPSSDPFWLAIGYDNNTILHIAFKPALLDPSHTATKTRTISWLLCQPFSALLRSARNIGGYTPAEAFELYLRQGRTFQSMLALDFLSARESFRCHTSAEIACLFALQGRATTDVSADDQLRASHSCTCGKCSNGFLSPRMLLRLQYYAQEASEKLKLDETQLTPARWVLQNQDLYLKYVERRVLRELSREGEKAFLGQTFYRDGVCEIFQLISECFEAKVTPTTIHLLQKAQEGQRLFESSLGMHDFLRIGGNVSSLVDAVFELVTEGDKYQGSGDFDRHFALEIEDLPECYNDHEIGFVRRTLTQLESLSPALYAR